jgi:hypothetical protein
VNWTMRLMSRVWQPVPKNVAGEFQFRARGARAEDTARPPFNGL